jgi:hypothetical protein
MIEKWKENCQFCVKFEFSLAALFGFKAAYLKIPEINF